MSTLAMLWDDVTVERLGWFLVHSAWIGCVVGIVALMMIRLLHHQTANLRYLVLLNLLAVIPLASLACVLAFPQNLDSPTADKNYLVFTTNDKADPKLEVAQRRTSVAADESLATAPGNASSGPELDTSKTNTVRGANTVRSDSRDIGLSFRHGCVAVWLLGVGFLWCRLCVQWLQAQACVRTATKPTSQLESMVVGLKSRMLTTRPVRVLMSSRFEGPVTFGWLRPVLLLPLRCVSGLENQQLEAIIAHELAHIRRHDYLINAVQTIVESLFFFHPAIWWLGARIRKEREYACDDLAVQVVGDRLVYARALTGLAGGAVDWQLAVAASDGDLSARIRRVLGLSSAGQKTPLPILGVAGLSLTLCAMLWMLNIDIAPIVLADGNSIEQSSDNRIAPISGTVVDQSGQPLAGAIITLRRGQQGDQAATELSETTTNATGTFEFTNVAKPTLKSSRARRGLLMGERSFPLEVIARKPGHAIRWQRILRARTDIAFRLKPATSFSGTVVDAAGQAAPGVPVQVLSIMSLNTLSKIDLPSGSFPNRLGDSYLDLSAGKPLEAITDDAGRFTLNELPNRVGFELRICDGKSDGKPSYAVTPIYAATTNQPLPEISVAADRQLAQQTSARDIMLGNDIKLSRRAIVRSGDVLRLDPSAPAKTFVFPKGIARAAAQPPKPVKRLPSITYRFVDSEENPVEVTVLAEGDCFSGSVVRQVSEIAVDQSFDTASIACDPAELDELRLFVKSKDQALGAFQSLTKLAASTDSIILQLTPLKTIIGTVVDQQTGLPLADAVVSLEVRFESGGGRGVDRSSTDAQGGFRFPDLIPGLRYVLEVKADNCLPMGKLYLRLESDSANTERLEITMQREAILGDAIGEYQLPSFAGLSAKQRLEKMRTQYTAAREEFFEDLDATNNDSIRELIIKLREPTQFYTPEFMRLANEHRGTDVELSALIWIARAPLMIGSENGYRPLIAEAADRLIRDYSDSAELAEEISKVISVSSEPYASAESLMKNSRKEIQGIATFTAGVLLQNRNRDRYGDRDDRLRAAAIQKFEQVVADYSGIPDRRYGTLGEAANRELFGLTKLIIGQPVPELEGLTLNGRKMKLSEFRGKTVLLHYWEGNLHSFDKLKRIIDRYDDGSVVVLGITTDKTLEQAIAAANQLPIEARHWHDPDREISSRWNRFWPNTHLVDKNGILRYLGDRSGGDPLEEVVRKSVQLFW